MYDFGHNVAGMVRLALPAGRLPPGAALRIDRGDHRGGFQRYGRAVQVVPRVQR